MSSLTLYLSLKVEKSTNTAFLAEKKFRHNNIEDVLLSVMFFMESKGFLLSLFPT